MTTTPEARCPERGARALARTSWRNMPAAPSRRGIGYHPGLAAGRLRGPVRLGAVLLVRLLGRTGAGTDLDSDALQQADRMTLRQGEQEMLAAKIVLAVAVLNLLFLLSELAMNVAPCLFRLTRRAHAGEHRFLARRCESDPGRRLRRLRDRARSPSSSGSPTSCENSGANATAS